MYPYIEIQKYEYVFYAFDEIHKNHFEYLSNQGNVFR